MTSCPGTETSSLIVSWEELDYNLYKGYNIIEV